MVTYVVFIGAAAAQFACTIVAAVLAAPLVALAIAAAIIPTLAGQHWTLSWIEESPFEIPESLIGMLQAEIIHDNKESEDIARRFKIVLGEKSFILELLNSVIEEGDRDDLISMNNEIEGSLMNLNDLKERAGNCKSMILKARDEMSKKLRRASTL